MTTRLIQLATAFVTISLTAACGSGTPATTTAPSSTFHAEVTDPVDDAVAAPGVPNPPDLTRGTVDVTGSNVIFSNQFATGTLDPATTRLTIELDTDQNPSTGNLGAGPIGIDYIIDMWAARSTPTLIQQATPATCVGGVGVCYVQVGTASIGIGTDRMTTTVSLAMLGNGSGRLNYRVFAYRSTQPTTPTVTADVMPDIGLPAAHVP